MQWILVEMGYLRCQNRYAYMIRCFACPLKIRTPLSCRSSNANADTNVDSKVLFLLINEMFKQVLAIRFESCRRQQSYIPTKIFPCQLEASGMRSSRAIIERVHPAHKT